MDFNDTVAFVAVIRAGSFTAAAARLRLPKGTVSRRVARLERALGVRLVQRTTRRLSLTDSGRAFYERCLPAVEELEDASRSIADTSAVPRGTIRLTAPFDFGRDHLSGWLREFRERYPEVHFDLELTQRNVDLVAEGFDVAIRGGHLPDGPGIVRKLASSGLKLFATPGYLARRGEPASVDALAGHDVIAFGVLAPRGRLRLGGPDGPVEIQTSPWLLANEFGMLRAAVLQGLGIGLLEEMSVAADLRARRLRRVLPDYGIDGGGLYALYPTSRQLSPKVRVLIDFMVGKLGGQAS